MRWREQIVFAAFCLSILHARAASAANLSPLAPRPQWKLLEKYQETITHDEFTRLIQNVYCTHGIPADIVIGEDSARILEDSNVIEAATAPSISNPILDNATVRAFKRWREEKSFFTLRFAKDASSRKRIPRWWRPPSALPPAKIDKPLSDLKIALDPGHLGGKWAKMEERWFQVDDSLPVKEGDMTLRVARLLAPRLRKLGAEVSFVRNSKQPITPKRPDDFVDLAKKILKESGVGDAHEDYEKLTGPEKKQNVRAQSELLFYRRSEIRYRAVRVNTKLQPDLVLCLHLNAEPWGDPKNPTLVDKNHLHLLVNGSYLESELEFDDQRFEMLRKLLGRNYDEELPLAEKCAEVMSKGTQLPPYEYTTETVTKVGSTGYVYARNLMATRLYRCPVVYFEPYVMNSKDAFARIQAGDYEGMREINGIQRKSIFREYADGVVDGLAEYYRAARGRGD